MLAVVLLTLVLLVAVGLVWWYSSGGSLIHPPEPRPEPERMRPAQLRQLVIDLLDALGLTVVEEEVHGDERRLVVAQVAPDGSFYPTRYVVFVEPTPPGDIVQPPLLNELADSVRAERAALGMLVTPYAIVAGGTAVEAPLDLVDGARLRELVERYLPQRLPDLQRYRGFSPPLAPQPL